MRPSLHYSRPSRRVRNANWTRIPGFARMGSPDNRNRRCIGTGEVSMDIATMTAATVSGAAAVACYAPALLPAPPAQALPAESRTSTD